MPAQAYLVVAPTHSERHVTVLSSCQFRSVIDTRRSMCGLKTPAGGGDLQHVADWVATDRNNELLQQQTTGRPTTVGNATAPN